MFGVHINQNSQSKKIFNNKKADFSTEVSSKILFVYDLYRL